VVLTCIMNERVDEDFFVNRGLVIILPIFSLFFFLLCVANMAAPTSVNLLSEIYLMGAIMGYDKIILLIFPIGSFLGAVFRVYLFFNSQHGSGGVSKSSFWGFYITESHRFILHILPLYFLVTKFEIFIY